MKYYVLMKTWTYSRLLFILTVLSYYPFNPLKRVPTLNNFSLVIEITRSIIISLFLKVKQKTQSDSEGGLRRILWKQMLQGVHWRLGSVKKPSGKKNLVDDHICPDMHWLSFQSCLSKELNKWPVISIVCNMDNNAERNKVILHFSEGTLNSKKK